jgi:anti-sigma factor RsiW
VSEPQSPLSDALFNGFVDGRLGARADREVSMALEGDKAGAARAAAWRRQSEALRTAFAPIADEPLPLSLVLKLRAASPHRVWSRTALVGLAGFVSGLLIGAAIGVAIMSLLS